MKPVRITGMGVWWIVSKCGERAKLDKKCYPHLLRHSRLTELSRRGANEQVLKFYAGWSDSSQMPAVYCHLSAKDSTAVVHIVDFDAFTLLEPLNRLLNRDAVYATAINRQLRLEFPLVTLDSLITEFAENL